MTEKTATEYLCRWCVSFLEVSIPPIPFLRNTQLVAIMEQELLTLHAQPHFCAVFCIAQSLVFCDLLFDLSVVIVCLLYYLSFELRLLVTALVSSDCSYCK